MYSTVPSPASDVCADLIDALRFDAYGWDDMHTDCDFFLDYEIDEETWDPRKKKPWRYRWPDEVHDEVLARLLDLNQERYTREANGDPLE